MNKSVAELEATLDYSFRSHDLLSNALTHSSRKNDLQCSNERLEFLGDAILGAMISEYLYRQFPDATEGDLTRIKSVVVSRTALTRVARKLDLGSYLHVAKGVAKNSSGLSENVEQEEPVGCGGRLPASLLANAFEAVLAAIYLDGGLYAAQAFIVQHMCEEIERASAKTPAHNYKSVLQHFVQRQMGTTPVYSVTAEEGPDHVKNFEVVTVIAGKRYGTGRGNTKKAAEQVAAENTLIMLGQLQDDDSPSDGGKKESP